MVSKVLVPRVVLIMLDRLGRRDPDKGLLCWISLLTFRSEHISRRPILVELFKVTRGLFFINKMSFEWIRKCLKWEASVEL